MKKLTGRSMAETSILIDTSGIYALLCKADAAHARAVSWLHHAAHEKQQAWISDYVLDETATLLKSRGNRHLVTDLFHMVEGSHALRLVFVESDRFERAKRYFLRHLDQGYSFTDCTSFEIMRELKLKEVLSTDQHFRIAGFHPLLA
jgi:predicted nucleic acid-binding protein